MALLSHQETMPPSWDHRKDRKYAILALQILFTVGLLRRNCSSLGWTTVNESLDFSSNPEVVGLARTAVMPRGCEN